MSKLFFIALCFTFCLPVAAQEDSSRQIIPEEFTKARPRKFAGSSAGRSKYQGAKKAATPQADDYQQLGLTLWRLRPAKPTDIARIIVHDRQDVQEWTPERMTADTPLKQGEKIRFTFESQQPGYLYVIDRERYADGSVGAPVMIFPTIHTRGGNNKVAPGYLIELPAQDDRPNYYTLKQSRPDQVGEWVTVIVSPQPLEGVVIGSEPLQLAPALVAQWEKQWGAQTEKFEMTGGAGRLWTRAEQEAGADVSRQLTQDDPGPQTVYRVVVKPGAPLLVNVGLKYLNQTQSKRQIAKGKSGLRLNQKAKGKS